jgi:hypothetical protein
VTPSQLEGKYTIMNQHLRMLEKEGLAASIYTQPFDVEGEENGLMTYDREVVKISFNKLREIHGKLNTEMGNMKDVVAQNADLTDPGLRYSRLLEKYLEGDHEKELLKTTSMMAMQVGDKNGSRKIGGEYIANVTSPLSEEDIQAVNQFTQSTTDPGFALMQQEADRFKKVLGERPYVVKIMNLLYAGEIKPLVENNSSPDWAAIEQKVKPYGPPVMKYCCVRRPYTISTTRIGQTT